MSNKSRDIELERQIDAYIKGRLSDKEAEQLWVRLMQKPEYISLLQTEIDLSRSYRNKSGASYYWKWIASAAAVILLVLTINIWSSDGPSPIHTWAQKNINIAEELASAEVTRSASNGLAPADSLLNSGYKAAISGNLKEATRVFRSIIDDHKTTPATAKAHLNLGILQYNAKKYDASINSFNHAISLAGDDSLLVERSYWYLSNAFVSSHRLEEARETIEKAYAWGNLYKKQALKLLKRLDYELGNIDFDEFEKQMRETE